MPDDGRSVRYVKFFQLSGSDFSQRDDLIARK